MCSKSVDWTRVDSTCAARLAESPRRSEILEKIGGQGRLEALFTEDRQTVAPTYYACSQAFTKYLVDRTRRESGGGVVSGDPARQVEGGD